MIFVKFDKPFYKSLVFLAIPVILQNMVNSFINILDTIMVGKLGEVSIAAVGLGNQVFFFFNMILFGITSGGGIFIAQYWGKKDIQKIRSSVGITLTCSLVVSFIFFVAAQSFPKLILGFYSQDTVVIELGAKYLKITSWSYPIFAISMAFSLAFRSTEQAKVPMIATIISLCTNAVFNFLLIFGFVVGNTQIFPKLGVVGAAVATILSRIIECVLLLSIGYKKKLAPAGNPKELFSFGTAFFAKYLQIGIPVILNETLWSFGITLQNRVYARAGTDVIAAFNISNTIAQISWVFLMGIGNASAVLIGKKIGEGDKQLAYKYSHRVTIIAPCVAIVVAMLLIPLSKTLGFFFDVNEDILYQAAGMLKILILYYPFKAFNMTMIVGVCRSGGDTVFSAIGDTIFMYCVSIPLASFVAFSLKAPAMVIFACLNVDDLCKTVILLWRLLSKKWIHDVTET